MLKNNKREVGLIIGLFSLNVVVFYSAFIYIPAYLVNKGVLSANVALSITSVNILIMALFIPMVGALADKFGSARFLKLSSIGLIVFSYPFFYIVNHGDIYTIAMVQCIMGILNAVFLAPTPAIYTSSFSANTRYSGVALAMNVSATVFGGTAPLIMMFFSKLNMGVFIQSLYLMLISLIALICVIIIHPNKLSIIDNNVIRNLQYG